MSKENCLSLLEEILGPYKDTDLDVKEECLQRAKQEFNSSHEVFWDNWAGKVVVRLWGMYIGSYDVSQGSSTLGQWKGRNQ